MRQRSAPSSLCRPGHFLCVLLLLFCWIGPRNAVATDCRPAHGVSPCLDSDTLWLAPGPSRFLSIPSASVLTPGVFSVGLGLSYLHKPVVIRVPSPDPDGRDVDVVGNALNASVLSAIGIAERFELSVVMPNTLWQTGSGVEGVTFQNGPRLGRRAFRDPRLGAGFSLVPYSDSPGFGAKLELLLGLPLGNEQLLAGESGPVLAPRLVMEFRRGIFFSGAELGLRLREISEFAGARVGSQLSSSLGVGVAILPRELLSVTAEAWVLPTISSQNRNLPNRTRVDRTLLAPAEWLFGVRSSPLGNELTLQLAGGTGLPLSSERRTLASGAEETEHFAGVTTPEFRFVFAVRYVAEAQASSPDGRSQPKTYSLKRFDRERRSDPRPAAENPASGLL